MSIMRDEEMIERFGSVRPKWLIGEKVRFGWIHPEEFLTDDKMTSDDMDFNPVIGNQVFLPSSGSRNAASPWHKRPSTYDHLDNMSQDMEDRMDSLQARYKKLFSKAKIPFWDECKPGALFSLKREIWAYFVGTDGKPGIQNGNGRMQKIEESTIVMLCSVTRDEDTGHIIPEWLIGEEVVKVYIPIAMLHKLEMKKS